MGEAAIEIVGVLTWYVFGHRGDQKILGKAPTQTGAWQAALSSAETVSLDNSSSERKDATD